MVIFIMNYFVVRRFFLQPINKVMEEREQETKAADDLYEQAMTRYSEATAHIESQVHSARRDAAHVREQFRSAAAAHRAGVVDRTHAEARNIVTEAESKLSGDVSIARARIVTESETLARLAAERILGRTV